MRSLSKFHREAPLRVRNSGMHYRVGYEPAESRSYLFGGNSNWRGPVWFPVNYLLIESLQRFHHYLGDDWKVECPTGADQADDAGRGRPTSCRTAQPSCSCKVRTATARSTATRSCCETTRTGGTWCCSTSTSTATTGAGLGAQPPDRLEGWWRSCWSSPARALGRTKGIARGRSPRALTPPRRGPSSASSSAARCRASPRIASARPSCAGPTAPSRGTCGTRPFWATRSRSRRSP